MNPRLVSALSIAALMEAKNRHIATASEALNLWKYILYSRNSVWKSRVKDQHSQPKIYKSSTKDMGD